MKRTLTLIICLVAAWGVQARMGYTREQCVEQYGAAIKVHGKDRDAFTFKKNEFEIEVFFMNGKVISIRYSKPGKMGNDQILKVERDRIVELNADGFIWAPMECPRKYYDQHLMNDLWRRSDGALACYNVRDYTLLIVPAGLDNMIFSDGKEATSGL